MAAPAGIRHSHSAKVRHDFSPKVIRETSMPNWSEQLKTFVLPRQDEKLARSGRLLSLLQSLRGKTRPVTASTLSIELGVSERTLYRDIAELIAQGAPIYGEAGVGYVLRQGMFLPPMMLTHEETEAVVLGLKYVDRSGDDLLVKAAREALAKIEAVLSPAAKDTLSNPVALPGPRVAGFPETVVPYALFRASIMAQRKLAIAYTDAEGAQSERTIWPIALGFMHEARVLVAWCEARQAYRTFRADRITAAEQLSNRYLGHRTVLLKAWQDQMAHDDSVSFAAEPLVAD
jgi:predicted DNA-binding transcriptional regulator YafY